MYNPQIPLVKSVSTNYTNMVHMPYGINCIVAIACYTGWTSSYALVIIKVMASLCVRGDILKLLEQHKVFNKPINFYKK